MIHKLVSSVSSVRLARALSLDCCGEDIDVNAVTTLAHVAPGCLCYSVYPLDAAPGGSLIIAPEPSMGTTCWLASRNPRLDFIRALNWLGLNHYFPDVEEGIIHPEADVHPSVTVEKGAAIGPGTVVGPYVHIHAHVTIGCHVNVGASTVIGHDGFGYERDESGYPVRFPHLANAIIADNVDIGNGCTVDRGALEDTVIGSGVKIDDQVYVAHNVTIDRNTLVMAGVRLNGRARIGSQCWIGTGALVREGRSVGDGAIVGMGSVVVNNIPSGTTVAGNLARIME